MAVSIDAPIAYRRASGSSSLLATFQSILPFFSLLLSLLVNCSLAVYPLILDHSDPYALRTPLSREWCVTPPFPHLLYVFTLPEFWALSSVFPVGGRKGAEVDSRVVWGFGGEEGGLKPTGSSHASF